MSLTLYELVAVIWVAPVAPDSFDAGPWAEFAKMLDEERPPSMAAVALFEECGEIIRRR